MLPQHLPLIGPPENTAALKLRNDAFDEIIQAARHLRRHDIIAVGRPRLEPFLQCIGDLRGGPDDLAMSFGDDKPLIHLSYGHCVSSRRFENPESATLGEHRNVDIRQWRIDVDTRQIGAERPRECVETRLGMNERLKLLVTCPAPPAACAR